jgi:prepilin-type N-terminal cleavage/methylation domain-containing protein
MRSKTQAGYSLLELVVAMVIFTIVMGIVFFFLIQTMNLTTRSEVKARELSRAKALLNQIRSELKTVRTVTEAGSERLSFIDSRGNREVLESKDGKLFRNDQNVEGGDRETLSLVFAYFSRDSALIRDAGKPQGSLVELEKGSGGEVLGENLAKINLIRVGMKYRTKQSDFSLKSSVRLCLLEGE